MTKILRNSHRALAWLLPALGLTVLAWALRLCRPERRGFWRDEVTAASGKPVADNAIPVGSFEVT